MGFRPDLDLKEILKNFEVFGGTPRLQQTPVHAPEYFSVLDEASVPPEPPDEPFRQGWGPRWCSSETALDITPRICWDVNGYYRGLGVHWKATRKELGEAFLARDGHSSPWLAYVLSQLLNPEVRRAYDRSPPGEPFLDDDFVQADLARKAYEEARRRTLVEGVETHRDRVLEEWGLSAVKPGDANALDQVDSDSGGGQDEPSSSQETWEYAFYLWRTVTGSLEHLKCWQELLLRELSVLGYTVRFSVGMIGKETAPYLLRSVGQDFIIFLNEDFLPTPELAARAVRDYQDL